MKSRLQNPQKSEVGRILEDINRLYLLVLLVGNKENIIPM